MREGSSGTSTPGEGHDMSHDIVPAAPRLDLEPSRFSFLSRSRRPMVIGYRASRGGLGHSAAGAGACALKSATREVVRERSATRRIPLVLHPGNGRFITIRTAISTRTEWRQRAEGPRPTQVVWHLAAVAGCLFAEIGCRNGGEITGLALNFDLSATLTLRLRTRRRRYAKPAFKPGAVTPTGPHHDHPARPPLPSSTADRRARRTRVRRCRPARRCGPPRRARCAVRGAPPGCGARGEPRPRRPPCGGPRRLRRRRHPRRRGPSRLGLKHLRHSGDGRPVGPRLLPRRRPRSLSCPSRHACRTPAGGSAGAGRVRH